MNRKDYCGPFWIPSWMRKFLSNRFNASCYIHDKDYISCKMTRLQADNRFLEHMLRQVKGKIFPTILAYCFYVMVRIGGWISYNKK